MNVETASRRSEKSSYQASSFARRHEVATHNSVCQLIRVYHYQKKAYSMLINMQGCACRSASQFFELAQRSFHRGAASSE